VKSKRTRKEESERMIMVRKMEIMRKVQVGVIESTRIIRMMEKGRV
jgi:hypothetical protein